MSLLLCSNTLLAEAKRYTGWQLTPDAEAKLAEFSRAGASCRLKNNKTEFVPRAQLKYTLSADDYIHCWFDRPLYQNSGLARFNKLGVRVNDAEAQAIRKALELGKCSGMASLLETTGRTSFFKTSLDNGIRLHGELTSGRFRKSKDYLDIAGMMLAAPNVYRFNGKPVITIYPPQIDAGYVKELKRNIVAKHGDNFVIVPYVPFYNKNKFKKSKPLTAADIEIMAEDLRKTLRFSDGILVHGEYLNTGNKIDNAFGFKVMIPVLHKIFSEDEFP